MVAQIEKKELTSQQIVMQFMYKWDLSYKELAAVLEVRYRSISRWATGERKPDNGYVIAVKLLDGIWSKEGRPVIDTIDVEI